MGRTSKWTFLMIAVTLYIVLVAPVLLIGRLPNAAQAVAEYLRPTTVEGMVLPQGCAVTNEAPPQDLMRIVRDQENLHHLTLQKVVVCRSSRKLLGLEQRFAGLPFGEESPWRTLYGGCCTAYFRRHVIVEVADPSESGSVVVHAALILGRWDYQRLNWNNVRPWAWRWCFIVALFLGSARLILLSGRALARAVHRVPRGSA
jgi:hypothetical protein